MGTHAAVESSATAQLRLTRRLIDSYLMVGLACVLACVLLVLSVSFLGWSTELSSSLAAVPIVLLLVGAVALRRTLRVPCSIEHQLRSFCESEPQTELLQPVRAAGLAAGGWNRIVAELREHREQGDLEQCLQEKLGHAGHQRWEAAFNSLSEGIALTGVHGEIEAANKSFAAQFERPGQDALVGQNIIDVFGEDAAEAQRPLLRSLATATGSFTCDFRLGPETADGVLRISRAPIVEADEITGNAVWSVRDVTQQRLAEEMRNQFVSTATHELRTPLANIKAYAETLAMETELDFEKQKSFYNIINGEASRLSRFIDELLDVSQMEAGAISILRHETDIERLISDVTDHLQPQIEQKQLDFECVLPPKLPKLWLDKDKISASLTNLLGNAIKYTPETGKVRVLIELTEEEIQIHVEDTGIGIAEDQLPQIGEKFFRADDQRLQDIPGSGLGVAFSQEVARLHAGRLTVLSELNKGSRFSLVLPLEKAKRTGHV